jgi:predicted  nucleic acid-binding Zn-ribbon protein
MEVKINGVAAIIKDVHKMKEQEIEQKYYQKHDELKAKIKQTPEFQKLQKQMDELENREKELKQELEKLTGHLGEAWDFKEKAMERLKEAFINVRIDVMGKEIEEVKKIITEFAKTEFLEG